jgi:phage shock protein E
MPGMTHRSTGGGGGMAGMAGMSNGVESAPSDPRSLSPEEFEARSAEVGAIVVNVHVPYEGEIAGTDAFVPYDQVATGIPKLAPDTASKILLYCKTGRMSSIAMKQLADLGYTNVFELAGGLDAWRMTEREVVSAPPSVP